MLHLRTILSEISKPQHTLMGTQILHGFIIKSSLLNDPFYGTKLIRLYGINKDLNAARQLFDRISQRSVYLWNSIIRAYAKSHDIRVAVDLFKMMVSSDTRPDNFTFACVLRAFSESSYLEGIRIVHGEVVVLGLGSDSVCSSALVNAYSKLGYAEKAVRVFDRIMEPDLVLWNSMISGFGSARLWDQGLEFYNKMREVGKLQPDGYTIVALLSPLANPIDITKGQLIHGLCLKCGFDSNHHVNSSLVSMYSRYKSMASATTVFRTLSLPDFVTWSALVTGFSETGQHQIALEIFRKMNFMGIKPDTILLASTLAASGNLTTIRLGREIHGYVIRHGFDSELMVSSALVDMYAKCGFLRLMIQVFDKMPKRNVVSYNTFISSLGLYGFPSDAFKVFDKMLQHQIKPDSTTFSALLTACCHSGLVKEGKEYFRRMKDEFRLLHETEHYVPIVKLLGMSGELFEAYELIERVSEGQVDSSVWGALLSCCEVHGNTEIAELVGSKLCDYDDNKPRYKVMMSNIYAYDGRWEGVLKLRGDKLDEGQKRKLPGISWIGDG